MQGLTERAGKQIAKFLTLSNALDSRVVRMSGGFERREFTLDVECQDDHVFSYRNHKVLVVDAVTNAQVDGYILDYNEDDSRFVLI